MEKRNLEEHDKPTDLKVEANNNFPIAALAIGLLLLVILKNPLVVLMLISAAAAVIAAVWLARNPHSDESKSDHIADLESTIADLEERLENVEIINHYETSLAERELEAAEAEAACIQPRS